MDDISRLIPAPAHWFCKVLGQKILFRSTVLPLRLPNIQRRILLLVIVTLSDNTVICLVLKVLHCFIVFVTLFNVTIFLWWIATNLPDLYVLKTLDCFFSQNLIPSGGEPPPPPPSVLLRVRVHVPSLWKHPLSPVCKVNTGRFFFGVYYEPDFCCVKSTSLPDIFGTWMRSLRTRRRYFLLRHRLGL